MASNIRYKVIIFSIILIFMSLSLSAKVYESTISIEPSKKSYTTIRYQVGEKLSEHWNVVNDVTSPLLVTIKDKSTTLFVQESKDGKTWTKITPFEFDNLSSSWQAMKKISYQETPPTASRELTTLETADNNQDGKKAPIIIKDKKAERIIYGEDLDLVDLDVGENVITVMVNEDGKVAKEYTLTVIRKGETPASPLIAPLRESITEGTLITMNSSDGASIYYTTDNSDPKTSPTRIKYNPLFPYLYNGQDEITIKAIAEKENSNDSAVSSRTYKMAVSRLSSLPFNNESTNFSFNPNIFTYPTQIVEHEISSLSLTPSSDITIIANNKEVTSSSLNVQVGENIIKVIAREERKVPKEYTFNIKRMDETPIAPLITPEGESIVDGTPITMSSSRGSSIYYTTDSSDPKTSSTRIEYDSSSPYLYNGPDEITLKAIAEKENSRVSELSRRTYKMDASQLSSIPFDNAQLDYSFNPKTFIYPTKIVEHEVSSIEVTHSVNATISVNETIITSSTINVEVGNNSIKVVAREEGKLPSEYIFNIERRHATPNIPIINPSSGAIAFNTPIVMSSSDGASIYYTTDNSDPETSPTRKEYNPNAPYLYNEKGETTLKAIAVLKNSRMSELIAVTYQQAISRLSSIPFDNSSLNYVFDSEIFHYPIKVVEHSVSSLDLTSSSEVTTSVNGKKVTSSSISLEPGMNTIKVVSEERGKVPKEYNFTIERKHETPTPPSFNPSSGAIELNTPISMNSTDGSSIYYTTDNSDPKTSSTRIEYDPLSPYLFNGPDEVTLKAVAVYKNSNMSEVSMITYKQVQSRLSSIMLSDEPFGYTFDPDAYNYMNIEVEHHVDVITLTALAYGAVIPKEKIYYLSIEPSKSSYSSIRYQVDLSDEENWIATYDIQEPIIVTIKDRNSTLYVQESKDGIKWSDITPYRYEEKSLSWKAGKKISTITSLPLELPEPAEEPVIDEAEEVEPEIEAVEEPVVVENRVSYLYVLPSKKSFTSLRYQVGQEVTEEWNTLLESRVIIEDTLNSTLYVQESKDGVNWSDITPYAYEIESRTWKAGKKISYNNKVEPELTSDDSDSPLLSLDVEFSSTKRERKGLYISSLGIHSSYQIPIVKNLSYYNVAIGGGIQMDVGFGNNTHFSLHTALDYHIGFSTNSWVDYFHEISPRVGLSYSFNISKNGKMGLEVSYGPIIHITDMSYGDPPELYVEQIVHIATPLVFQVSPTLSLVASPYGSVLIANSEVLYFAGFKSGIRFLY